jgi:hypothetical protein
MFIPMCIYIYTLHSTRRVRSGSPGALGPGQGAKEEGRDYGNYGKKIRKRLALVQQGVCSQQVTPLR